MEEGPADDVPIGPNAGMRPQEQREHGEFGAWNWLSQGHQP
jgi:hypothetical protein